MPKAWIVSVLGEVETGFGWISLPGGGCKPSVVCSDDTTRPRLTHGYLRPHGDDLWLYATNSYVAVGLKVVGTATEGWVPRPALEAIERGDWATQLSRTAWRVGTMETITYDIAGAVGDVEFPPTPDLHLHDKIELAALGTIAVDPALTLLLAEALGARGGKGANVSRWGTVLRFSGTHGVIRVMSQDHSADERVGSQMPCRARDEA